MPLFAVPLISVAGVLIADRTAVTPEAVEIRLSRLAASSIGNEDTARAAAWLANYGRTWAVRDILHQLERLVRTHPDCDVRGWCLVAISRAAAAERRGCPRIALDAIYDDCTSSYVENHVLSLFRPVSAEETRALIRCATSDTVIHRRRGTTLLGDHASHSADAIRVLHSLTEDPDRWVRHNAHCALFAATKNLPEFLAYLLRFQSEYSERPEAEGENEEDIRWALAAIGVATLFAGWTEGRPVEFRDSLVQMMAHRDPLVRRAAVSLLGRLAVAAAEKSLPGYTLTPSDQDPRLISWKQREGRFIVIGAGNDRLQDLASCDPDEVVRKKAAIALGSF